MGLPIVACQRKTLHIFQDFREVTRFGRCHEWIHSQGIANVREPNAN